ncbi:MAG: GDP-L-fucose synthase family protein [Bdellovibrionales bacterium]
MTKPDKIFVTGHRGLLGSAVIADLKSAGYKNLLTATRAELDLTDEARTHEYLRKNKPDAVIHCAALVGGIQANTARPAEFLQQNLSLQNNVIHGSHLAGVNKLIFFGSNCMYPTGSQEAMPEEHLLQGPIEPSNLAYGAAKIAGFVQCQSYHKQYGRNYMTVIPASLYGPHDNYDVTTCHVTPAILLRMHLAKKANDPTFTVWGTGKPRRELLFVGDAARGVRMIYEGWDASMGPVNLGCGTDISVAEIAESIKKAVGYTGNLVFDTTKPDGNYRKLLDSTRIGKLGFAPQVNLFDGLALTYKWLMTSGDVRGIRPEDL